MLSVIRRAKSWVETCSCINVRFCGLTSSGAVQKLKRIRKYLISNSIKFEEGYTCLSVQCRLCEHNSYRCAYIPIKTGIFLCPNCDVRRNSIDIAQLYEKTRGFQWQKNCGQYRFPQQKSKLIPKNICDSFEIIGLNVINLQSIGCCYSAETNTLHFPLKNAANLIVGEKTLNLSKGTEKTIQKPNCSGVLIYGKETKTKAVVVSNIIDFLAIVAQNLENYAVVCLPYALKFLPQECLPALEVFNELILWLKHDSSGYESTRTISQKLNIQRCLLIRPTESEPSPHDAFKNKISIGHILQKAMPIFHKSITNFGALKQDILKDLQNIDEANGVKWKRFPMLNKLLKGHRKGELTIITGLTGSGKTTFMSEYSLDLALQGVSTLWGSFEIKNSRLASTLLRQFVGYSLEKKLDAFEFWSSELEKYPLYFMTLHGQQPLKIVMQAIEHAKYVLDISHVIIDNLQFMMGVSVNSKKDKFWEQDEIIASFRSYATKYNIHVTLVMHPRKEREEDVLTVSSVFGSAKATQEADNVLIIQDKRLLSTRGQKYLQVVKNRYSGDLGVMPLDFNKDALSFANKNK